MKPIVPGHPTKPIWWIPITVAAVVVLGSSAVYWSQGGFRFARGQGDAGDFILRQAILATGHPAKTNGLPALTNTWRYARDQYGVVIWLAENDYTLAESFLRQAFDPPTWRSGLGGNPIHSKFFRLSEKGGAVYVTQGTNSTEVIVVRPIKEKELGKALRETVRPSLVAQVWQRVSDLVRSFF